jgi:acyl-CoA dehydrogenase
MKLAETIEEQAFRHEVQAWMASHLVGEFAALHGRHGPGEEGFDATLAKRWEQELAAAGWVGIGWPASAGGAGLPLGKQIIFHEEYVRAGGPGRLGHIGEQLFAPTLIDFGTPEQQARFLPGIRAGREYWAQGYSEPGAGSDLANVRTRARPDAASGEWVIDGQKVWTSWAQEADWIFVLARTTEGSQRHHGLSLLLVPLHQAGISVRPIRQMTGGAEFNEVFFEGARTAASLHLGPVGEGWKVAMALLGYERGVSTLGQQAQFRHELDLVMAVAKANGAARDPVLRQRIAAAALGLATLRFHALRVLGDAAGSRAAYTAKYAWSNWRRDLGQLAIDVLDAAGDVVRADDAARTRLQQVWLSSRADTIYAGTNEIQLNLIAERALGMPREERTRR